MQEEQLEEGHKLDMIDITSHEREDHVDGATPRHQTWTGTVVLLVWLFFLCFSLFACLFVCLMLLFGCGCVRGCCCLYRMFASISTCAGC